MQKAVTDNVDITRKKRNVGAPAEKERFFSHGSIGTLCMKLQGLRLTAWITHVHDIQDCKATCIILQVMHVIPHLGA